MSAIPGTLPVARWPSGHVLSRVVSIEGLIALEEATAIRGQSLSPSGLLSGLKNTMSGLEGRGGDPSVMFVCTTPRRKILWSLDWDDLFGWSVSLPKSLGPHFPDPVSVALALSAYRDVLSQSWSGHAQSPALFAGASESTNILSEIDLMWSLLLPWPIAAGEWLSAAAVRLSDLNQAISLQHDTRFPDTLFPRKDLERLQGEFEPPFSIFLEPLTEPFPGRLTTESSGRVIGRMDIWSTPKHSRARPWEASLVLTISMVSGDLIWEIWEMWESPNRSLQRKAAEHSDPFVAMEMAGLVVPMDDFETRLNEMANSAGNPVDLLPGVDTYRAFGQVTPLWWNLKDFLEFCAIV